MANAVLICHHGRVFSNAFQHLGRTLSVVVTKRSHRFLKIAVSRSAPSRWSNKIRLSSVHTIVSLSLNADEILDLST